MMRRRARATVWVVLATAAASAMAGCVSMPTSGPVEAGRTEAPEQQQFEFAGQAPQPGDSPDEILSGFLRSMASGLSGDNDFSLARTFLTSEAGEAWLPLEEVLVYATDSSPVMGVEAEPTESEPGATTPPLDAADAARATITVRAVAAVDATGVYAASANPEVPTELEYRLTRVDGEWRIDELPNGMLLSEPVFSSLFRQMPLYFWTPDFEALVPDIRYFPSRNAAGYAVTGLLRGPTPWLSSAVATRIPDGVTLNVASTVVVEDNVARVNLSAEAQSASFDDRKYMYTQIERTLLAIQSIHEVELTMGGAEYQVPTGMPDPIVEVDVGSSAVVLSDGRLARMQGSSVTPIDGVGDLSSLLPAHPAVGYGDEGIVMLSGSDALVHVSADGAVTTLLAGQELAPPSFDRQGWIWTSPRTSDGTLVVTRVDGEPALVSAPWLEGAQVLDVRVSREGARLAVLLRRDGVDQLVLAGIVRDAVGTPRTVPEGMAIASRLLAARAVVWVDSTQVGVLAQPTQDGDPAVRLVVTPGPYETTQSVPAATSLAAGNGPQQVLLGTTDEQVLTRRGLRWELTAEQVTDPAFPG